MNLRSAWLTPRQAISEPAAGCIAELHTDRDPNERTGLPQPYGISGMLSCAFSMTNVGGVHIVAGSGMASPTGNQLVGSETIARRFSNAAFISTASGET